MQRAIQNTRAATHRRSRPLRVAGSTLTANVAFAVLKYAALTAAGVLLFRWGQGYALAERGYEAIGGEALLLGLPLFWYLTETTIRDTVRDFRKGGRRREQERERQAAAESAGQFKVDPETGAIIEPESEAGDDD